MLVKQDLINRIKDYFDLNIYETKVWLALLSKGVASAGQIAEASGIPRSRTYDVLESLEKKGFALIKLGKPVKYIGVRPHIVLEKLKNNLRKSIEEKITNLSGLKETNEFLKLEEIYKKGISPIKAGELSAVLKGKSNISNYLNEILKSATNEVIICTNAEDVRAKLRLFKQTLDILFKRKIKVKIALSGEDKTIKRISEVFNNIPIKKIDIDAKFFIIDRREILFYVLKESNELNQEDIVIWINSEFFSQAFASLFDRSVEKGAKLIQ
ncbi:hypothetical protein K0A97_01895 [Patescibacteria group bacterium]|nr:hypothetical protein [Patescibacteria group bacterium]